VFLIFISELFCSIQALLKNQALFPAFSPQTFGVQISSPEIKAETNSFYPLRSPRGISQCFASLFSFSNKLRSFFSCQIPHRTYLKQS